MAMHTGREVQGQVHNNTLWNDGESLQSSRAPTTANFCRERYNVQDKTTSTICTSSLVNNYRNTAGFPELIQGNHNQV